MKDYYRLITGVDEAVGKILAKLEERRLAKNTVVIFTSDNGFYLGDRGLAGKWFMHEESIRVPLMIYDPRAPKARRGARVENMALLIDLAPTIVELAGADVPRSMQGRSLAPLMRGEPVDWRKDWFYEHLFNHRRIPKSEGVRGERWKYVNYFEIRATKAVSGKPAATHEELYDLENDPLETKNLAKLPEHGKELERLRSRLRALKESVR